MWIYFDENGTLIHYLDRHGPTARVGSTDFQIFAYFENVDTYTYNVAQIKFIKDDFNESGCPTLFMTLIRNAPFVLNEASHETEQSVYPFVPGHKYTGYIFDFANFNGEQDVAVLLDTPGKWRAVITLYATIDGIEGQIRTRSVQGTVEFNVEGPRLENDPYIASLDDIMGNIAQEMSSKAIYFITVDALEGDLSESDFIKIKDNNLNRIVYNNIVYYYAITVNNTKRYFSIVEQQGGNTNYNEIDVDLETGHYTVEIAMNKYLEDHINNRIVHITQAERNFWNNKVTTLSGGLEELILTKD